MDILSGLNEQQRRAVEHDAGPLLVVAGAGTGKTRVITHRIAYLIDQGKAKPHEILALTFTEKAAREMQERLYDLIGWQSFQVPVMTFHAFGTELLGRFASHIGRSVRGGLLNDTQKALLLRQHIPELQLSYYGPQQDLYEFAGGVVDYIGALQNAGVSAADYLTYAKELRTNPGDMHPRDVDEQMDLANLYALYERIKADTGTFDYSDQLRLPLEILQARPNVAERLAAENRYVLVDEYQDTNAIQDELLRAFVGKAGNLFAVGDDDQAIYGFRGADISNILGFAEHFEVSEPVVLTHNYRSGQEILDAAYRLIQHNDPQRLEAKLGLDKRLVALPGLSVAEYQPYLTVTDEQEGVMAAISARVAAGESPESIAVLAATHAPLRALAKLMRSRGMPFALSTSVNIFEQPELLGLWYLMQWLVLQADEESIGHVIMGPFVGWPAERYRKLLEASRNKLVGVEEALREDESEEAQALVSRLDTWRLWAQEVSVSRLAFQLVFETGRADLWRDRAQTAPRMVRVFEDLQRWFEQLQDYETVAVDTTVSGYFKAFPRPPALEVAEPVGDAGGVQLLTVHASKGLEFQTVYVVGCTQRSWSGGRGMGRPVPEALRRSADLPPEHEFRRLMYVAVTRAQRNLFVSSALQTGGGAKQTPSPFISELVGPEATSREPLGETSNAMSVVMERLRQYYPRKETDEIKRLPFESSDGWLDLSVTALGSYEFCPFEFYIQHVLQIKQPIGPQLAFGNVLHKVIEVFYKGRMAGEEPGLEELRARLDELWSDRGYESRELAAEDHELAHKTLAAFVGREAGVARVVVGSEVPIRLEQPEPKLRLVGKIDVLFETAEGIQLRDFKTGRTKTDPEKLAKEAKENFQLRTYALAYEALNGSAPAEVALDYVVTQTEGVAVLSPAILRNHQAKLAHLAERIRLHDFAPNPSPMHHCAAIRYYGTGEADDLAETAWREAKEGI